MYIIFFLRKLNFLGCRQQPQQQQQQPASKATTPEYANYADGGERARTLSLSVNSLSSSRERVYFNIPPKLYSEY